MTSAQVPIERHAPPARWRRRLLRRVASVALLLGWCAFWLAAALQPCCKLSVAAPHTLAADTVSLHIAHDNHGDAGHHTPDSSDFCHDITIAAGAALAAAASSVRGEQPAQAYPASLIGDGYVRRAIYAFATHYLPLPPPRTLPFHLRTARILI